MLVHKETNHVVCTEIQMTGFYMECITGQKWVKRLILYFCDILTQCEKESYFTFFCYIFFAPPYM